MLPVAGNDGGRNRKNSSPISDSEPSVTDTILDFLFMSWSHDTRPAGNIGYACLKERKGTVQKIAGLTERTSG